MKRKMMMLFAMVMAVSIFVACGKKEVIYETENADTTMEEEKESEESEKEELLKIALLVPGLLGDKSFFDAANASCPLIEAELGATTKVVEMGLDQTKWYPTFVDFCEKDYDLILTVSPAVDDILNDIAMEYPDQLFMNIGTGSQEQELQPNVYAISTRSNEMSFLAGSTAALKAKELGEDKIGFIGGMDIPGINEFLVGYIDGAQHVNADIKVATGYVGSFTDPTKAKENALLMFNSGVSVIYAAAGQSGLGVIDAAKELKKFAIGVDSDQAMALKDSSPESAAQIITSAVNYTPQYTLNAVRQYIAGEIAFGTKDILGLKEGGVGITKNEYYEKLMSEDSRKTIEDIEKKVAEGEITIIKTSVMPTEELEKIRDSVRP